MSNIKIVLDALKQIKADVLSGSQELHGICSELRDRLPTYEIQKWASDWQDLQYPSWEFWSGCNSYPVPGNLVSLEDWEVAVGEGPRFVSASNAYDSTPYAGFWDESTEYGRLRMDLLMHLIKCAEEECDE